MIILTIIIVIGVAFIVDSLWDIASILEDIRDGKTKEAE